MPRPSSPTARLAIASVTALALTALLWELALAPIRPGGSWLALKALPLIALLPGTLKGSRRALQWLALLLPLYFAEGLVRGWSESGRHAVVAWVAAALAAVAFCAVLAWVRRMRA